MNDKLNYCSIKGECGLPDDIHYTDCKYGEECLSWGCTLDHCSHEVGSSCTSRKAIKDNKQGG